MKLHPAEQEKTTTKVKHTARRSQAAARRSSQQTAVKSASRATKGHEGEVNKEQEPETTPPTSPSPLVPSPIFVRRDITAPDGSVRPGWEMWIGDHCFGRADSKELLLASFQRLQSPPESFHWREVRNRMQMRGRLRPVQPVEEEKEDPWAWGKKEGEDSILLEEGAEGFQELSLENPA